MSSFIILQNKNVATSGLTAPQMQVVLSTLPINENTMINDGVNIFFEQKGA